MLTGNTQVSDGPDPPRAAANAEGAKGLEAGEAVMVWDQDVPDEFLAPTST